MNIAPNLSVQTVLNTTLISRPRAFESEGHGHIAKGPEGGYEGRLLLILYGHLDLVIS